VKLWKTLVLLLAFVVLGVYAYKTKDDTPIDKQADRSVVQLCGFKTADDVAEITVTSADGTFTLTRAANPKAGPKDNPKPGESKYIWSITAPFKSDTDAVAVDSYVKALLTAKATEAYSAKQIAQVSDKDAGLDQPKASVTLKGVNGRTGTLLFGAKTPKEDAYYSRVKGGNGLLIFAQYYVDDNTALKKLSDIRDKTLLKMAAGDVKSLTLTFPKDTIKLTKDKDSWTMETGGKTLPADTNTVENMIATLATQKIDKFVDQPSKDLKTYGLDAPPVQVSVNLGDKGELGLLLGSQTSEPGKTSPTQPNQQPPRMDEKVYVQRKGETDVMQAPKSLYDALLKTPDDLRDKVVLAVNVPNISKLSYTIGDKRIVLERAPVAGSKDVTPIWQLREPAQMSADSKKTEHILNEIKGLQVVSGGFIDAPAGLDQYGLDKPRAVIELTDGKDALPKLLIGKSADDGSGTYVKRDNAAVVMKVPAATRFLTLLEVNPNRLRDLSILKLDRAKVQSIVLKGKDRDSVTLTAKGAGDWQVMSTPVKPPEADKAKKDQDKDKAAAAKAKDDEAKEPKKADAGKVAGLLTDLEDVRGDEWMADKADDLATYGLKDPEATVVVTTSDGKSFTLLVGKDPKAGSTSAYLKLDGKDPIYRNDDGTLLMRFQRSAAEFEPMPQQPMGGPMGMMGGGSPGGGPEGEPPGGPGGDEGPPPGGPGGGPGGDEPPPPPN
jgi:hypothetical protein